MFKSPKKRQTTRFSPFGREPATGVVVQREPRIVPVHDSLSALFGVVSFSLLVPPVALRALSALWPAWAESPWMIVAGIVVQQGCLLVLALWRLGKAGVSWGSLRPYVERPKELAIGVSWGVTLLLINGLCVQLSIALINALFGEEAVRALLGREQALTRLAVAAADPWVSGAVVFGAVGLAPVVEELFFRGYVHGVLKAHTGGYAVWLSALLFAGVHRYVINFLPLFVLGVALARLYERAGSLATAIVAHAAVNASVTVIAALARSLT